MRRRACGSVVKTVPHEAQSNRSKLGAEGVGRRGGRLAADERATVALLDAPKGRAVGRGVRAADAALKRAS